MADVKKSLLLMGAMGIILLVLVVVFAVALLIGSKFQEQICVQDGATFSSGQCQVSATDTNLSESVAYNATVQLIQEIATVVGFIGIVVLTAIGAILIGMARSFLKEGDM